MGKVSLNSPSASGGYPQAVLPRSDEVSGRWIEALIRSYLERDLNQLGFRVAAPELRRFWDLCRPTTTASLGTHRNSLPVSE